MAWTDKSQWNTIINAGPIAYTASVAPLALVDPVAELTRRLTAAEQSAIDTLTSYTAALKAKDARIDELEREVARLKAARSVNVIAEHFLAMPRRALLGGDGRAR